MNHDDERDYAEEAANARIPWEEDGCRWFVTCTNVADGWAQAPWGRVACCERCARVAGVEVIPVL